jgi:hypothetical protein
MRVLWRCALPLLLFSFGLSQGADLPHTRLDRIFPLGGQAGSNLVLEITAKDSAEVKNLHFDDPGLNAQRTEANKFKVTIAPETPPGAHDVRALGPSGLSGARLFMVSRGLGDVREVEPNDAPEQAQTINTNVAINGSSDTGGTDHFRFAAKKGERFLIECQAYLLDSPLRAVLAVSSRAGTVLARCGPSSTRQDPIVDFLIPEDGDYIVSLHDLTYLGELPYRLVISNRPWIDHAFPPVIGPKARTLLAVRGRNLPGSTAVDKPFDGSPPLEELLLPLDLSQSSPDRRGGEWINLPTAACALARGVEVWPKILPEALNPLTVLRADDPLVLEHESNNSAGTAQPLALPCVLCGRIDVAGDRDWYSFVAHAGATIGLDLCCERLGLPGDLFIVVFDAGGNEVASLDDHGDNVGFDNVNVLMQFNRDPVGTYTAPADGRYRILVQERHHRGGPQYLYALRIGPPAPDFLPVAFHEATDDASSASCPILRRGGSACYPIYLNRRNGFDGFVTVEAEGLPAGVSCPPVTVGPQAQLATLVFTARADAPEWAGPIRLMARATLGGQPAARPVAGVQRRWGDVIANANANACRLCRQTCLAVRGEAPYGLRCPQAAGTVAAGGFVETKVSLQRRWPDFHGKVQVTGLSLPPGFDVPAAELPEKIDHARIRLNVAREVPPGTYTVVLRGEAQVPYSPDPKVQEKPTVRVADPATPLTVVVSAPKDQQGR